MSVFEHGTMAPIPGEVGQSPDHTIDLPGAAAAALVGFGRRTEIDDLKLVELTNVLHDLSLTQLGEVDEVISESVPLVESALAGLAMKATIGALDDYDQGRFWSGLHLTKKQQAALASGGDNESFRTEVDVNLTHDLALYRNERHDLTPKEIEDMPPVEVIQDSAVRTLLSLEEKIYEFTAYLSDSVPEQAIFLSSLRSRRVQIGRLYAWAQHANPAQINRRAAQLAHEIRSFLDAAGEFVSQRVAEDLSSQVVEPVTARAHEYRLASEADERARVAESLRRSGVSTSLPFEGPVVSKRAAKAAARCALSAAQEDVTPSPFDEQAETGIRAENIGRHEIVLPWLTENGDKPTVDVVRFRTQDGSALVVDAFSNATRTIYDEVLADNPLAEQDLIKVKKVVAGLIAPEIGNPISRIRGLKPLLYSSRPAGSYEGMNAFGYGNSKPNAPRTYLHVARAGEIFGPDYSGDPMERVAAVVAYCDKKRQIPTMSELTGFSAGNLKKWGVGSV